MSDVKRELEQRYGRVPKSLERDNSETLNDAVASNLATAKWLLAKDKNLASFVFAMPTDGKSMIVMQLQMEDRAGKHIAIRRVASFLSRHQIKWAMLVGESWIASFDPDKPLPSRHAIDYPNRREAITVQGVSVDGSFSNRYVKFSRRGDKIIFGEEKADYHPSNILLPILKAMKKPND